MSCGGIDIDATPRQSERRIKKKKEEEKNRGGSGGRGKRERERKRRSFVSWVIQFRNIDKVVVDMRVIRGAEGVEKKKWKKKEIGRDR